jgi:hypothetical protein
VAEVKDAITVWCIIAVTLIWLALLPEPLDIYSPAFVALMIYNSVAFVVLLRMFVARKLNARQNGPRISN